MNEKKLKKSISRVLLSILLPVTAAGIVFIIFFLTTQARKSITKLTFDNLKAESEVNAKNLALEYEAIEAKYDKYAEILESAEFESQEELFKFLEETVFADSEENFLITISFEDDSYVLSNHQRLDESWKPTQRPWYQQAWQIDGWSNTEPYIDSTTGNLGISLVKKYTLKNGMKGAFCIDAYLMNLHDEVAAISPLGMGKAILLDFDHGYVISYLDEDKEIMGKIFGPIPAEADSRMEIISTAAFDAFEAEYLATKRLAKEREADQRKDLHRRLVKALKSV